MRAYGHVEHGYLSLSATRQLRSTRKGVPLVIPHPQPFSQKEKGVNQLSASRDFLLRPEPGAIFTRDEESLNHLGLPIVAIELIQFVEPEVIPAQV